MLDRFLIGRVSRMSPEAPVPVVVFDHEEFRLGGAANVANNLRELGGAVDLIGVIGNDESGAQLKNELAAKGIHSTGLITDPERRTTTKMRVVTTRNQQVSRIDFESDHEVGARDRGRDRVAGRDARAVRAGRAGLGLPEGRRHAAIDGAPACRSRTPTACR